MRILIASVWHEGSTFSSITTSDPNFTIVRGEELIRKAETSRSSLGGAYRRLREAGVDIVPSVSAVAPPGGPVEDELFDRLCDELNRGAGAQEIDGIFLDLHGGMVTVRYEDAEGQLLAALRQVVGPQVPIAVSLDLHAHLSAQMLAAADIIVACKENPHIDYDLTGERAAELLIQLIRKDIAPVTAASWVPMIVGSKMETGRGPLLALHDRRREFMKNDNGILDVSIYNITSLLDVTGGGQCVSVICDGDSEKAKRVANELASQLWASREQFTPDFAPIDEVLAAARTRANGRPTIIGDQGDRVLAGTPGDGTFVLAHVAENWPDLSLLTPVTDPDAVAAAKAAGVGAQLDLAIGAGLSNGGTPFHARWTVLGLGDGHFIQEGPYLANEPSELGATATLRSGNVTVLATELPGFTQDPAAFRSQGLIIEQFDAVVVKSGYHFKLSFASTGDCVVADTPGISNYRPGRLPFIRRRPSFPEDALPDIIAFPQFASGLRH